MNLDFKNLNGEQESALRKILSSCNYLFQSSTWRPTDEVIRRVADSVTDDYRSLLKATEKLEKAKLNQ
jgi:hypothetical protein